MFRLERVIGRLCLEPYMFTRPLCAFWDPKMLTRLLHKCYVTVILLKVAIHKTDVVFQLTTFDVFIDSMAKGFFLSLWCILCGDTASMFFAAAGLLYVLSVEDNVRSCGLIHVFDNTPLATLLENLTPRLLLWSWLFVYSCFILRSFQRSGNAYFL
jgi:hypothetical protein